MIKDLVEKKKKVISKAEEYCKLVSDAMTQYTLEQAKEAGTTDTMVVAPKAYLDRIYSDPNYFEFVKCALAVKSLAKKISSMTLPLVLVWFIIPVVAWFISQNAIVTLIAVFAAAVLAYLATRKIDTGESYQDFYRRTMVPLMLKAMPGFTFNGSVNMQNEKDQLGTVMNSNKSKRESSSSRSILTTDELSRHYSGGFDSFSESNTITYSCQQASGGMCDLVISKVVTRTTMSGVSGLVADAALGALDNSALHDTVAKTTGSGTTKTKEKVFDGFYLKSNMSVAHNVLRDYKIAIRDDNDITSLAEDTINAIHQSEKDYQFNSEELNKTMDCKITIENLTKAVDKKVTEAVENLTGKAKNTDITSKAFDPVFTVHKLMTPAVEEKMLFLKHRYNSFNMDITDRYISMNVNLDKTFFQKAREKSLFDGTTYADFADDVEFFRPVSAGTDDFKYANLYPVLERLYLVHYVDLLYLYVIDQSALQPYQIDLMKRYELEVNGVMNTDVKEFKMTHKDEIDNAKNAVSDIIASVGK